MEFRIVRTERDESSVPDVLSEIEPLDPAEATVERDMVFGSQAIDGHHGWTINGEAFAVDDRSEERRVGKESRTQGSSDKRKHKDSNDCSATCTWTKRYSR